MSCQGAKIVFSFQPMFISRYTLCYTRCVMLMQLFILYIHSCVQAMYCFRGIVKTSYSSITDVSSGIISYHIKWAKMSII